MKRDETTFAEDILSEDVNPAEMCPNCFGHGLTKGYEGFNEYDKGVYSSACSLCGGTGLKRKDEDEQRNGQ